MTHRRYKKDQKALEKKSKEIEEAKHKNRKRIYAAIVSLVLILLVVYLAINTSPAPMQCFSNGTQFKEQYTAKIFIFVGSTDYQFIRIPRELSVPEVNSDFQMGIFSTCKYPITIEGKQDYGANWTLLHIQSPVIHDYTLGDFFLVWSQTVKTTVHFGSDGVGTTAGRTVVQYNFGAEQPASPEMVIHPDDWIIIRVYTGE